MNRQKRFVAMRLCAFMLLVLVASSACIVAESHHCCTGKGCLVCRFIAEIESLRHSFECLLQALLALFVPLLIWRVARAGGVPELPRFFTLVSRETRLNN